MLPGLVRGKGERMKKGFVLTFSVILFVSLLVLFAMFYLDKSQEQEQGILSNAALFKAGFLADDIEADFNKILGTSVDINRGNSLTTITFNEKLGADTNKLLLKSLKEFVEGALASSENASIQLDVSELVDGRTELMFSNGLQYNYSYKDINAVQFYLPAGNTNIAAIDLNVSINAASISVTPWEWQDETGDINVNLHYVDRNSSNAITHYGKLDSTVNNEYTFTFPGGAGSSFTINIGNIDGNLKAVRLTNSIDDGNVQAGVWLKVLAPSPESPLRAFYNADLNFSQADVNINRKVGVGES